MTRALLLAATLPILASCHPGELLTAPVACSSGVATPVISVGPGVQPAIDWSPGCRVSELWIEALEDSASAIIVIQWGKWADAELIRPPVRVGIDSTTFVQGPREIFLNVGVDYKACIISNEHPGYWSYVTCTEFTP